MFNWRAIMLVGKLKEALSLSKTNYDVREYVKNYSRERYNKFFGKKHRLYLPLGDSIQSRIALRLRQAGFTIADYTKGLAQKNDGKNLIKIGKILNKLKEPAMLKDFNEDRTRQGEGFSTDNLMVVISRHPYDIAGMSTDRNWSTCMNLVTGSNKRYIICDIQEGSIIAYLIKTTDKNINNPLARIIIKPYIHEESGKVMLFPEGKLHGRADNIFRETVTNWLRMVQPEVPPGLYKLHNKLYPDIRAQFEIRDDGEVDKITTLFGKIADDIETDRRTKTSPGYMLEFLYDIGWFDQQKSDNFEGEFSISLEMDEELESRGIYVDGDPESKTRLFEMFEEKDRYNLKDEMNVEWVEGLYNEHTTDNYVIFGRFHMDAQETTIDKDIMKEIQKLNDNDRKKIKDMIEEVLYASISEEKSINRGTTELEWLVEYYHTGHLFLGVTNKNMIKVLDKNGYNKLWLTGEDIDKWVKKNGYKTGYSNYLDDSKFMSWEQTGLISRYIKDKYFEDDETVKLGETTPTKLLAKAKKWKMEQ